MVANGIARKQLHHFTCPIWMLLRIDAVNVLDKYRNPWRRFLPFPFIGKLGRTAQRGVWWAASCATINNTAIHASTNRGVRRKRWTGRGARSNSTWFHHAPSPTFNLGNVTDIMCFYVVVFYGKCSQCYLRKKNCDDLIDSTVWVVPKAYTGLLI